MVVDFLMSMMQAQSSSRVVKILVRRVLGLKLRRNFSGSMEERRMLQNLDLLLKMVRSKRNLGLFNLS
jgi:hypothetical protein